ncbi:MAG: M23 family metallopeptidase [Flavobacteriales bacterium]|nr:M23 family metallopeptidase [Flavobacteriales bacterium]MBL6872716.1 M23 family metallopeptidase [Flavobacteriales bacterium]
MSIGNKKQSFWKKWRFKYRFVILNSETFEERLSFNMSRLNVFLLTCVSITLLIGGTTLIIAFSPLREYIPGYTSTNIRRQMVSLNQLSDSLKSELDSRGRYLQNIRNIIEGVPVDTSTFYIPEKISVQNDGAVGRVYEDSLLRERIESEDRFNFFSSENTENLSVEKLLFFKPVDGLVTQSFNADEEHYGVDVVSKENELIKSTLSGIVVFSSWTSETGNVIAIQHANNFVSVYKHNSALLKQQGEMVEVGESIAIIGNSGKWSSGPHLHFELWHNNQAVNPENYILF